MTPTAERARSPYKHVQTPQFNSCEINLHFNVHMSLRRRLARTLRLLRFGGRAGERVSVRGGGRASARRTLTQQIVVPNSIISRGPDAAAAASRSPQ